VKGFILAAGYGERLRPLTDDCAKALVPVLNIPSICYSLFLLKEAGVRDVVCNLHHEGDGIVRFFEENDFFGLTIEFSEEDTILGTGGGLKKCEALLGDDDFVLINSDIVMDADLRILIDRHRESGTA
jgi:mannose-1-phosphate guanylyltransferase